MKKEILICTENNDITSDKVISWLNYYNYSVSRLNDFPRLNNIFINHKNDIVIRTADKKINLSEYHSIWLRRGFLTYSHKTVSDIEIRKLELYLNFLLENKYNSLGTTLGEITHNKMIDFFFAEKHGLNVPKSWIINTKHEFKQLKKKYPYKFITKAIHNNYLFKINKDVFSSGNPKYVVVENLEDNFMPSLIQQEIDKTIDIRIVALKNKLFSMAIFSQSNKKTQLSYKNYDSNNPNRMVPYCLPKTIHRKLISLLNKLNLNFCSIDMIKDSKGEFYFLEINRQGQIDWLSGICNYNIEKEIALSLINS